MAYQQFSLQCARGEAISQAVTLNLDITGWTLEGYFTDTPDRGRGIPLVTLTASPAAGITVVTAGTGNFTFALTSTQTKTTMNVGNYTFEIWRTNSGSETMLVKGVLTINPSSKW